MKNITVLCISLLLISKVKGQDIQPVKLSNLLKKGKATHTNAILIYKENKLYNETYFDTVKAGTKIETMSCTKSIVGLAVACLQADGLIDSLDEPVCKFYPEWNQGQKKLITLRHLVNMTSGIQNNPNATVEIYPSKDFVQLALCAELSSAPGEKFEYNNKALNLIAGIFQKVSGKRMDIYIGERLFKPLGISDYAWTLDQAGNPHVMSGCQLKPFDFAKLGLMLINRGNVNGKQIVPARFLEEITVPCKQFDGYGELWWIEYEKSSLIIDDQIIHNLAVNKVSEEFINELKKIKGIYFSEQELKNKIVSIFGTNFRQTFNANLDEKKLKFFKRVHSGNIFYKANGYLGNYIIVVPKLNLVAIRMISEDRSTGEETVFDEFGGMIVSLTN